MVRYAASVRRRQRPPDPRPHRPGAGAGGEPGHPLPRDVRHILEDRVGYYRALEGPQKADLDISAWLDWFLRTLLASLRQALARIDRVPAKSRYWQRHRQHALGAEQLKVLNRLLDGGERGFENGISAAQYQSVAKVSKATATRHLGDLQEKGYLQHLPGGGRSTRYRIADGEIS